jgi:ParB family transcriptional regulator, chromosome partitioning protein
MSKTIKKRGLGKGLEALIPSIDSFTIEEENLQENELMYVNINKIYPNEKQPRKEFDKETLRELAASIKNHGLIQPIIVVKKEDGFMIIAGERRWRAAKEAHLKEIPCIVREYEARQLIEVALVENIQRENLNVIEEAQACKHLIKEYSLTQDQLAEVLGKSRSYIANIIRLLQLDMRVIQMVKAGSISGSQGRALLALSSLESQYETAKKIEYEKLNVRQVEALVKKMVENQKKAKKKPKGKDVNVIEIEEKLKYYFGTKVSIVKGRKKGKIEIEYYNDNDLERILELLKNDTLE